MVVEVKDNIEDKLAKVTLEDPVVNEEGSDDDQADAVNEAGGDEGAAKKKKKKKNKKKKGPKTQTEPPTVPVSKIFTTKIYPVGECHDHRDEYVASSFDMNAYTPTHYLSLRMDV